MTRTYEAVQVLPKGGTGIIISRGTKEHVKRIAEISQILPYKIKETPESSIKFKYWKWRLENGNRRPNRAIVKMHWEDGENTEKGWQQDVISLKDYSNDINLPADDERILYYVSGLKGLISLTEPNNGSEFVVDEVIDFYIHE